MGQQPGRPTDVCVQRATVRTVARLSPGFVRVVLHVAGTSCFTDRGLDQWVRLFLPAPGEPLLLPDGGADGWYARWQALPAARRPTVRNYTVRLARRVADGWELDVDLVVHTSSGQADGHADGQADGHAGGEVEGVAAAWALQARPGDQVGLLEQGVLFRADVAGYDRLLLLVDESGLPGLEAVLRALPAGTAAEVAVEVPDTADARDLPSPAEVEVHWYVRAAGQAAGSLLAEHLERSAERGGPGPGTYLYSVGESSATTRLKERALGLGLAAEDVDACAYWVRRRSRT